MDLKFTTAGNYMADSTNTKVLNWTHSYTTTINDTVEVPHDFEIAEHYARWGKLVLVGKDGREIEFQSDLDLSHCELECKRPAVSNVYDDNFNEIEGLEYE